MMKINISITMWLNPPKSAQVVKMPYEFIMHFPVHHLETEKLKPTITLLEKLNDEKEFTINPLLLSILLESEQVRNNCIQGVVQAIYLEDENKVHILSCDLGFSSEIQFILKNIAQKVKERFNLRLRIEANVIVALKLLMRGSELVRMRESVNYPKQVVRVQKENEPPYYNVNGIRLGNDEDDDEKLMRFYVNDLLLTLLLDKPAVLQLCIQGEIGAIQFEHERIDEFNYRCKGIMHLVATQNESNSVMRQALLKLALYLAENKNFHEDIKQNNIAEFSFLLEEGGGLNVRIKNIRSKPPTKAAVPMKKYIVDLESTFYKDLTVFASVYRQGCVVLKLADGLSPQRLLQIKSSFYEEFREFVQISNNEFTWPDTRILPDLYAFLTKINSLTGTDRSNISALIKTLQQIHAQSEILQYSATPAQKRSLLDLAEPYLDGIFSSSDDVNLLVELIGLSFHNQFYQVKTEVTPLFVSNNLKLDVFDDCEFLWKITQGHANMEGHLLRLQSNSLPSIQLQRSILIDECLDRLQKMMTQLSDINQFLNYLLVLMCINSNLSISPFGKMRRVAVFHAMTENHLSVTTHDIFANTSNESLLEPFIITALSKMSIITDGLVNLDRMRMLYEGMESPVIAYIFKEYQFNLKKQNAQETSPLYSALKSNDTVKVRQALLNGEDVNKYFVSKIAPRLETTTPLKFALQTCSSDVINTILDFQPDLNILNSFGVNDAVILAMNRPEISHLSRMLMMGVNLFYPTFALPVLFDGFNPDTSVGKMSPLAYAIEKYTEAETPHQLQVIKLLLQHGAAIGCELGDVWATELDGLVAIAATVPKKPGVNPILTVEDFMSRVPVADFQKWKIKFKQAYQTKYQSNNAELKELLPKLILTIENILQTDSPSDFGNQATSYTATATSPIHQFGHIHHQITLQAKQILGYDAEIFLEAFSKLNYNQALRRACTVKDDSAVQLLQVLFAHKDKFNIDPNEKAGDKQQTSLHHAARKNNLQAYQLLIQHGASDTIADADGMTPAVIAQGNGWVISQSCNSTHI